MGGIFAFFKYIGSGPAGRGSLCSRVATGEQGPPRAMNNSTAHQSRPCDMRQVNRTKEGRAECAHCVHSTWHGTSAYTSARVGKGGTKSMQ